MVMAKVEIVHFFKVQSLYIVSFVWRSAVRLQRWRMNFLAFIRLTPDKRKKQSSTNDNLSAQISSGFEQFVVRLMTLLNLKQRTGSTIELCLAYKLKKTSTEFKAIRIVFASERHQQRPKGPQFGCLKKAVLSTQESLYSDIVPIVLDLASY